MRKYLLSLALGSFIGGTGTYSNHAFGTTFKPEVAFKNLEFDRPVVLTTDGSSERLYIVEQHTAKIWSFPNDHSTKEKKLFFKLPHAINTDNEEGLLGLAFHPQYKTNGYFYVYYSAAESGKRRSVVSRFTAAKSDLLSADPKTEQKIWVSEVDPYSNHNGGTVAFGPDGYLYIALGDSGSRNDPLQTGQDPSDWFGSILRIDVDKTDSGKNYSIPKDNPRLRDDKRFAKWAPEVYAIGLRNVWKFSFDGNTLWAPDVGQNAWEEVNIIENGGNYGWSVREGQHDFPRKQKVEVDKKSLIEPIFEYPHSATADRKDIGQSVTGGFVYRGEKLSALKGSYIFGDFVSGRIWALKTKDDRLEKATTIVDPAYGQGLNISSFGIDANNELYVLAFDGKIYSLVSVK